jgi:hypothetical protein
MSFTRNQQVHDPAMRSLDMRLRMRYAEGPGVFRCEGLGAGRSAIRRKKRQIKELSDDLLRT